MPVDMNRHETWLLCVNCAGTGAVEVDGSDEMCKGCDGWGRVPGPNPPRADWRRAPSWAMWWAVNANGMARWYSEHAVGPMPKPYIAEASFAWPEPMFSADDGYVEIPIGIDWRICVEQRPEAA